MRSDRFFPVASLMLLLLSGCGPGATSDGGVDAAADLVTSDQATAGPDLGSPDLERPDLVVASSDGGSGGDLGPLDCAMTVACTRTCTAQGSGACVTGCIARATPAAQVYFQPLEQCASPACSQHATDAGPPPCSDPSSDACWACVQANCKPQLNACLAH